MKQFVALGSFVVLLVAAAACPAQTPPEMPAPSAEHKWLDQIVGEWETEGEVSFGEGQPLKCKGTETVRSIGGFWVLAESHGTMPGLGIPVTGLLTLGYDPESKKYVGTWADSTSSHLWKYAGSVDESGKILTLETEGPNPLKPGQKAKYRETLEIKSKDHKVFSSALQGDDGKWITFVTINAKRKK